MDSGHTYHPDDSRCISCGVDKRTGANVLCTDILGERGREETSNTAFVDDGVIVTRPDPLSEPREDGTFEDTRFLDDYLDREQERFLDELLDQGSNPVSDRPWR
jgi:hypothetical protein